MSDRLAPSIVGNDLEMPDRASVAFNAAVATLPPGTVVILFAIDLHGGAGVTYVSNAVRAGAIALLEEWLRHERHGGN